MFIEIIFTENAHVKNGWVLAVLINSKIIFCVVSGIPKVIQIIERQV